MLVRIAPTTFGWTGAPLGERRPLIVQLGVSGLRWTARLIGILLAGGAAATNLAH